MWESTLDGRQLHFHLVGLNNRNFIMQDEETGTWWQQVTGKALLGPLKGKQLKPVPSDMITRMMKTDQEMMPPSWRACIRP